MVEVQISNLQPYSAVVWVWSIKIVNRFFEAVAEFKYLGTTLTDQNSMHEEIKSRLNSGNACYYSIYSHLSSRLLSRNVKVKIY
jgi:hypothetical protein